MLIIPADAPRIMSIIGIDPGSTHLGVGVIEFDVTNFKIVRSYAFVLNGEKLGRESWTTNLFGDRLGRIYALQNKVLSIFRKIEWILDIACEAAFINVRRPAAYGALTEVICAMRQAVRDFDPWKPLYMVEASVAKAAVGAKGNSGEKDRTRKGLMAIEGLQWDGECPLEELSEHASDGLAIAYARYKQRLQEFNRMREFVQR